MCTDWFLVFICLLSIACITLSWLLSSYLTYKASLVVITAIPGFTALITITWCGRLCANLGICLTHVYSLLIRPIAKSRRIEPVFKQTVLWEVIWTAGLIPFNISMSDSRLTL